MKKSLIKRTADALEKLAVGSILVGLFQDKENGIWFGVFCMIMQLCANDMGGEGMSIWAHFILACLVIAAIGIGLALLVPDNFSKKRHVQ